MRPFPKNFALLDLIELQSQQSIPRQSVVAVLSSSPATLSAAESSSSSSSVGVTLSSPTGEIGFSQPQHSQQHLPPPILQHTEEVIPVGPTIIAAHSAGYSTHTRNPPRYRAYFEVNGRLTESSAACEGEGERGWNLLIINPVTREVVSQDCFDVWGAKRETHHNDREAVKRLVEAIRQVPEGFLVVLAVKDEGSSGLTDEVYEALRSCGGSGQRIAYRSSFAMIGIKGMTSGQATEGYDDSGGPIQIQYQFR
jgi:hypothetical protein